MPHNFVMDNVVFSQERVYVLDNSFLLPEWIVMAKTANMKC